MEITKLHIIDWYDDIITAITFLGNEVYIFHCIKINLTNQDKTYYSVKIDDKWFQQIEYVMNKKIFSSKDWKIINSIFEKNNKSENIFLFKTKLLSIGSDITFIKIQSPIIIKLKFPFDISVLYS
ncbi:hypothetical protein [Chryseobacterium sp. MMS23-Vi53]|uniref:hypothetical protein n=1 Tax=Chryseobacterium sp. MMS23-Vi53 TaxID=3386644 RepID=UPI0039E85FEC